MLIIQWTFRNPQVWMSSRYIGSYTITVGVLGETIPMRKNTLEQYASNTIFPHFWKIGCIKVPIHLFWGQNISLITKCTFINPQGLFFRRWISCHTLKTGLPLEVIPVSQTTLEQYCNNPFFKFLTGIKYW